MTKQKFAQHANSEMVSKMKRKLTQQSLFQSLERGVAGIPDDRKGNNTKHSIRDTMFIAFSTFFLQSKSLDNHIELLNKAQGRKNRSLIGIKEIPTPNQIRNILDPIDPSFLYEVQDDLIFQMQRSGVLKEFLTGEEFGYLMPLDGTEYFRSKCISCPSCCQVHHGNGTIDYHHRVLLSGLCHPTQDIFLPVTQEFIVRQDGVEKEDCELNAGYRWIKRLRERHPQMKLTILADDLFCKQPFLEKVLKGRMNFIIACKPGSHKTLYEWIDLSRKGGELATKKIKRREGKQWLEETYEYANNVPIKDAEKALHVGFVQVTTVERDTRKIIGIQAFVTNVTVTVDNCICISSFGRKKWKIENEGNNTLKNLGYHLEHNYGHGKQNLSAIFVTLMLMAFMMHTILSLINQEGFAAIRKMYDTMHSCMEAIRGVFRLIRCTTWEQLYQIGQVGLDTS